MAIPKLQSSIRTSLVGLIDCRILVFHYPAQEFPNCSPRLPSPPSAFSPKPYSLGGCDPDTPVSLVSITSSHLNQIINHTSLPHLFPKTLKQILSLSSKIAASQSVQDPAESLHRNASLGGEGAASQMSEFLDRVARRRWCMSMMMEAYRRRQLGGKTWWQKTAPEVKAECCNWERFGGGVVGRCHWEWLHP